LLRRIVSFGTREDETVRAGNGIEVDMHGKRSGDERRHANRAPASGALRRSKRELAVDLRQLASDGEEVPDEVDVCSPEARQLAPAKAGVGGGEDDGLLVGPDGSGEGSSLFRRGDLISGWRSVPAPLMVHGIGR
jgi:hypothetical protein